MYTIKARDRRVIINIASMLAVLGVWQFASGRLVSAYFISTPLDVASAIVELARDGELARHLISTLTTTLIGFSLAAVCGIGLALALGNSRLLDRVLGPFVFAAFSMPKVVLAPLLLLWLGVGKPPSIALAFVTSFFLVFYNVLSGIRRVSPALLNAAAVMAANRWQTAFKIMLPAAAPQVATGLHQGLIYAFHGAILGEMTASNSGMGYLIVYAATSMDSNTVLAALIVIAAISYGLVALVRLATGFESSARLAGEPA